MKKKIIIISIVFVVLLLTGASLMLWNHTKLKNVKDDNLTQIEEKEQSPSDDTIEENDDTTEDNNEELQEPDSSEEISPDNNTDNTVNASSNNNTKPSSGGNNSSNTQKPSTGSNTNTNTGSNNNTASSGNTGTVAPEQPPVVDQPKTCNKTQLRPEIVIYKEIPCGETNTQQYMNEVNSKLNSINGSDNSWNELYKCFDGYGDQYCVGRISTPSFVYNTDYEIIGIAIEFSMYHYPDNISSNQTLVGKGYIAPNGTYNYSWKNY